MSIFRIGRRTLTPQESVELDLDARWVWRVFEIEVLGFGLTIGARAVRRRTFGF